jgi:hypothetical protein
MFRTSAALVAVAVSAFVARAADASLSEGNWRVTQITSATSEVRPCLIKVEKKDGKLTASVLDTLTFPPQKGKEPEKLPVKLLKFTADGNDVRVELDIRGTKWTDHGVVGKDPKLILGSFASDRFTSRGSMSQQEGEKLEAMPASERPKMPEPYAELQKLYGEANQLFVKARQAKDVNEKGELEAKAKDLRKQAEAKAPEFYRQTVEKHGDSPFAIEAASSLLRLARKAKATPQDVAAWVKLIDADAARYDTLYVRESALDVAQVLLAQKGFEEIALSEARKAAEAITEKDPLALQARSLKLLVPALKGSGKADEAKALEPKLAKIEQTLDDEYLKTVPPFKTEKLSERKDKDANRVAVMELFTGAQCPPCVAADVAFDGLEKTYEPKDVILIQYHLHIPGPDPMTNPETVARYDYYMSKFPKDVGGTPSTLFNGKPATRGGGPMDFSSKKYAEYQKVIGEALDEKSPVKLAGSAKREGEKVKVDVNVEGVKDPGDKVKVRVLLLEETIKYAGGNGLRFHHHVVRNMPKPMAVDAKGTNASWIIDLASVKSELTKYLDEYASENLMPTLDRPMDLKHLKAVALVQDDETGEILNALQIDVK